MPHDVFISYSSEDKQAADDACGMLESNGIGCWIAPRNVPPGAVWARSIVEAIEASKLMVLIFSGRANKSGFIEREVGLAANHHKPIIAVRIEDIAMSKALEFYLNTQHWLNAFPPPLDRYWAILPTVIQHSLNQPDVAWETAVRSPNAANLKLKWPNAWSYFAPADMQQICWEAVTEEGIEIERYSFELYLDETRVRPIGEYLAGSSTHRHTQADDEMCLEWLVPDGLPQRKGYRVKVTAWDKLGTIGSAFSEFFTVVKARPSDRVRTMASGAYPVAVALFYIVAEGAEYLTRNSGGQPGNVFDEPSSVPIPVRIAVALAALDIGTLLGATAGLTLFTCPPARYFALVAAICGAGIGWALSFVIRGVPAGDLAFAAGYLATLLAIYYVDSIYRNGASMKEVLRHHSTFWESAANKFAEVVVAGWKLMRKLLKRPSS